MDRAAVVARAEEEGVLRILNPGIDLKTSQRAVELALQNPAVYAAVGAHPNELGDWGNETYQKLKELARSEKVVAIGEIGLDYYWDKTDRNLQWRAFEAQLELAVEIGLPVVIHTRDKQGADVSAIKDALCVLESWQSGLKNRTPQLVDRPGVLHSFSGDDRAALRAVKMGFFIGITGPVTYKKADTLKAVVKTVPIERLVCETDAPFLTPHPYRGKRNEPAFVQYVVAEIAKLREMNLDQVLEIMYNNAKRLFHW